MPRENKKLDVDFDVAGRYIYVGSMISDRDLYSRAKDIWTSDISKACVPFPFMCRDDERIVLTNDWSFSSISSYECVEPRVIWDEPVKPEAPIAPATILTYDDRTYMSGVSLEELLHGVPKGINLKSTRVHVSSAGDVVLRIPGMWPNNELARDEVRFERELSMYRNALMRYERMHRMWRSIEHRDT